MFQQNQYMQSRYKSVLSLQLFLRQGRTDFAFAQGMAIFTG